ncbi:DNA-methyltransferase [Halogeometricum borinquense]|uniref:DNA-methyltransferase n=1 Tax=Halogeometricum borinquense TaxID=60847 RepID=UPI0034222E54
MEAVPDESVDLVITSPPYHVSGFTCRPDYSDYDDSQGIDEWEALMEEVFSELFRVTKPDAKVCMVLGTSKSSDERFRQHRLAAHAYNLGRNAGFDYLDGVVWTKNNFANAGGRDRPLFGSYPYPTNMLITQNHEQILVFRKWIDEEYYSNREIPKKGSETRESSRLEKEEWREYAQSHWEIEPVKNGKHPAQFPVELATRLIKLYSFTGDTVLDPFCGAGTTAVAAVQEGRHYCGYDLSAEYCELARERISRIDEERGS